MAATRDLLLIIGFLREGKMFPTVQPLRELPGQRSLRMVREALAEQEIALFGKPEFAVDEDDMKRRAALTSWSGDLQPVGARIAEVPDPGVLLCLLYDRPAAEAPLPVDVFAQTLRRYALRDATIRARFEEHVDKYGTFVPQWLSPDVRSKMSEDQFGAAMKVAREQGFAHAAPLFEGVRGDSFAKAQLAVAHYELRELGDRTSALRRLDDVIRVAPRNVAARMQRAGILAKEAGRQVEAGADYLAVLREIARPDSESASRELRGAAMDALWELNREFRDDAELDAAVTLSKSDRERGFDALSRYVQTHPCSWEAQVRLATLALARERFDQAARLLAQTRHLYPDDANPHFVYGQALSSIGKNGPALGVLEYALSLSPLDAEIREWLSFVRRQVEVEQSNTLESPSVPVSAHVARTLFLALGVVRRGNVFPSGMVLHKLPGDVSLELVLKHIAAHEQRRFADAPAAALSSSGEHELRGVEDRTELRDYQGEPLGVAQTVGDVPDPGVVMALLYERADRDEYGHFIRNPPVEEGTARLMHVLGHDSELHGKLGRHLQSAEATLKRRLTGFRP